MERRTCSECGRVLDGLLAVDHDAPGLLELLTGDDWLTRLALTVAICLIVALAVTCARAVLGA